MYTSCPDESALLSGLRAGDTSCFTRIYDLYWEDLYVVAFRKLSSEEDAKDIIHDLFFSLWQKRSTLMISTSLSTYLFSALKNRIFNQFAAQKVRRQYVKNALNQPVIGSATTDDQLAVGEITSILTLASEQMPPKMRQIFLLSRKDGLSIPVISAQLNISEQTVKNQISSALKIVKQHLKDYVITFLLIVNSF